MKSYEIVTVATHYEGMLESLVHNKYNKEIKVLGMGQKWSGFIPMKIYTSKDLNPHTFGVLVFNSLLASDRCKIKMSHFNSSTV